MGETLGNLLPVIQLLAKTPVITSNSPVTDLIPEQNKPKAFLDLQTAVPQPPSEASPLKPVHYACSPPVNMSSEIKQNKTNSEISFSRVREFLFQGWQSLII